LPHSHHRLSPTLTRDKAGPMPFIKQQQPSQGGAADDSSGAAVAAEATARPLYAFEHAPPVGSFAFPSALSPNGVVAYNAPCRSAPAAKRDRCLSGRPAGRSTGFASACSPRARD
jgi:hypothetical protein